MAIFSGLTISGGGITIAGGGATDPYFMYNSLLLPGNGTNTAQNNTFLDGSTNNFSITRNGNTTQGTFSPYGSNWSNYFGGTDYLSLADNANLNPGTQDFVMEAWVYLAGTTGNNQGINGKGTPGTDGYTFFVTNALVLSFIWNGTGGATITGGTLVLNTWNHVAVVRNSSVIRLYLNGVGAGSSTACTTDITSTATKFVGQARGGNPILGYMSNYRMTKGSLPSGYDATSASLTPPTAPLTAISGTSLLTCQSNRFVDNSASPLTITVNGTPSVQRFNPFGASTAYSTSVIGGSGYFDGTGDYLTAPNNAAFNFGTGNFTVECWVYVKSFTGSTNVIISTYQDGSNGWTIGIVNNVFYGSVAGDSVEIYSSVTPQVNTWTHLALTRSSTTLSLFVNGVVAATQSNSTNMSTASALTIGTNVGGGSLNFTGYITDVRVVKGTAVYTSAFTPPTTPLTAVANTSVLTSFTNAGIIDNTMINNLETVGNAQISTTQSKFGGSSMYFDGTGDYLTQPSSQNFNFGTGNFTMEGWFYQTGLSSSYPGIVSNPLSWGNAGAWAVLSSHASGIRKLQFYCYNADTSNPLLLGTTTLSDNTWYYFAVTRSDTTFRLFLDGTIEATATFGGNVNSTSSGLVVGINQTASGYTFQGYIDDLRITKGYARYTSNFTPPTAFPLN